MRRRATGRMDWAWPLLAVGLLTAMPAIAAGKGDDRTRASNATFEHITPRKSSVVGGATTSELALLVCWGLLTLVLAVIGVLGAMQQVGLPTLAGNREGMPEIT